MADCRFCIAVAVAVFDLDRGCVCFPEDREQSLCITHVARSNPLGEMRLKKVIEPGWRRLLVERFGEPLNG